MRGTEEGKYRYQIIEDEREWREVRQKASEINETNKEYRGREKQQQRAWKRTRNYKTPPQITVTFFKRCLKELTTTYLRVRDR